MSKREFDRDRDCITMCQFVNQYLGISANCENLRHSGLKALEIPLVVGVSNDFATLYPEYVYNGYLLMVLDSRNNRGTYINPSILHELAYSEELFEYKKQLEKKQICDLTKIKEHYDKVQETLIKCSQVEKYTFIINELGKSQKTSSAKTYIKKIGNSVK